MHNRDDTIVDLPTLLQWLHFGAPAATPATMAESTSDRWHRWMDSKAYSAAMWPESGGPGPTRVHNRGLNNHVSSLGKET